MRCPFCHSNQNKVIDSRPSREANAIRRRRECLNCQRRFTTYEQVEETMPLIRRALGAQGIAIRRLERIEPSMEDVFVAMIEAEERKAA